MLPPRWTDHSLPVGRGDYLRHGVALALLKFLGDTILVRAGTGEWWQPGYYFATLGHLLRDPLGDAPPWLLVALALWALPFLWLGASLTLRRAVDAGFSPWWAVGFFVPWVNYGIIGMLLLWPSRVPQQGTHPRRLEAAGWQRMLLPIAAGVLTGIAGTLLFTLVIRAYTAVLFLGLPTTMGLVTAFLLTRRAHATNGQVFAAVTAVFLVSAALAILLAIEGAVCIAMALPPVLAAGMLGAALGVLITDRGHGQFRPAATAMLALPFAAVMEGEPAGTTVREVVSVIEVAAPAAVVWREVVAFSPITAPPPWWGRLGIAYPASARIEGTGVGAVRYCEFSTGAFVEPITAWEPGRRLGFDVAAQPPPLVELSPWPQLAPPHLDGFLQSHRGEFRLVSLPDGRTRLEGSTWYSVRMAPEGYWAFLSERLIRQIHRRVLEHVGREAERRGGELAAAGGGAID
jgi:uncharacterized membrane protein YhaH (DUF805 family)/drug/metabolite transporter superfamily protein YnfA